MPGSRSSQRPCVSSMSSRRRREDVEDEAGRPARAARAPRAAPRAGRRRSAGAERAERADHERDALRRPAARAGRRGAGRRSTPARRGAPRAQTSSIPAEESTPITRMPAARDRHRDPAGADAELDDRARPSAAPPRRRTRCPRRRSAPRVVEVGDLVVEGHVAMLPVVTARVRSILFLRPRSIRGRRASAPSPPITTGLPLPRPKEERLTEIDWRGARGARRPARSRPPRRRTSSRTCASATSAARASSSRRCARCATARPGCC